MKKRSFRFFPVPGKCIFLIYFLKKPFKYSQHPESENPEIVKKNKNLESTDKSVFWWIFVRNRIWSKNLTDCQPQFYIYIQGDVVWETLANIEGDCHFVNHLFQTSGQAFHDIFYKNDLIFLCLTDYQGLAAAIFLLIAIIKQHLV